MLENNSRCHRGRPPQQVPKASLQRGWAQFPPRVQAGPAGHSENWATSGVPDGQQGAYEKDDQRKTSQAHCHTHRPRAAASHRAGTRTQGPRLWAQSLPWVGQARSLSVSSVNRALACLSLSFAVGDKAVDIQMLDETSQHRRPVQMPPVLTSAGPERQFRGQQVSARRGRVCTCPGT